jgi:hypothetical protein
MNALAWGSPPFAGRGGRGGSDHPERRDARVAHRVSARFSKRRAVRTLAGAVTPARARIKDPVRRGPCSSPIAGPLRLLSARTVARAETDLIAARHDDQERSGRLLLLGKGAVLAHGLAHPLAAELDEDRQPTMVSSSAGRPVGRRLRRGASCGRGPPGRQPQIESARRRSGPSLRCRTSPISRITTASVRAAVLERGPIDRSAAGRAKQDPHVCGYSVPLDVAGSPRRVPAIRLNHSIVS